MVPHMHPRLVDIGSPHEGSGVALKHQHPLAGHAAAPRRIQPVQPRAHYDFVKGLRPAHAAAPFLR